MKTIGEFQRSGKASKTYFDLIGEEYVGIKGQAAVDKLMAEKQGHIKDAFYREDRVSIFHGKKIAIIAFELRNEETTAVLTAFQK